MRLAECNCDVTGVLTSLLFDELSELLALVFDALLLEVRSDLLDSEVRHVHLQHVQHLEDASESDKDNIGISYLKTKI